MQKGLPAHMESHCQKQALCQQGNGRELLLDISMSPIITPRHINVGGGGGGGCCKMGCLSPQHLCNAGSISSHPLSSTPVRMHKLWLYPEHYHTCTSQEAVRNCKTRDRYHRCCIQLHQAVRLVFEACCGLARRGKGEPEGQGSSRSHYPGKPVH